MDLLSILNFIQSLLTFLGGLSFLVLVHEFGHFIAARRAGIKVEEFGLGFPPRVFGKKFGDTLYSLNALPIGGFVRLYGEDSAVEEDKKHSYFHQSKWVRTRVIVAGVLMNVLLGVIIFTGLYSIVGVPTNSQQKVAVTYVFPDSPASQAGLQVFDRIVEINGEKVTTTQEVKDKSQSLAGQETTWTVERSGLTFLTTSLFEQGEKQTQVLKLTPRSEPPQGQGPVGIGLDIVPVTETKQYPIYQMPFYAAKAGVVESFKFSLSVLEGLGRTVSDLATRREVPKDVAGPVGIFQLTESAAQAGILTLLSFFGILSINLAVINIMPFPALDGGRLFFIILEAITRKRSFPHIERAAHSIGMVLLLALLLLITLSDINRFILGRF